MMLYPQRHGITIIGAKKTILDLSCPLTSSLTTTHIMQTYVSFIPL